MIIPIGSAASSPSRSTQTTVNQPLRVGHQVVEQQEAGNQDHDQLRHQAQGLEEKLTGEVADQPWGTAWCRSRVPSSFSIASA